MKLAALMILSLTAACLLAPPGRAAQLNLSTLTCGKYESEIAGSQETAQPGLDAIDTVMWLFGFSVAKSGDHHMYGDALASFGFALDAECKNHPRSTLLQAVSAIRPKRDQPMDLSALNCEAFESRHAESVKADPDSAKTIMMWLFGFSVGLSGNPVFDSDGIMGFAAALQTYCSHNRNDSLFQVLIAVRGGSER